MSFRYVFSIVVAFLVVAGPLQAQRAPAPSGLSGLWLFEVSATAGTTRGAMTVARDGDGYRGMLMTDQGTNALPIRSLTLDGSAMRMIVESPNGNVTFEGRLGPRGRSFRGTMTYFNGRRFPMSGWRR
jgi:hypothetical protein